MNSLCSAVVAVAFATFALNSRLVLVLFGAVVIRYFCSKWIGYRIVNEFPFHFNASDYRFIVRFYGITVAGFTIKYFSGCVFRTLSNIYDGAFCKNNSAVFRGYRNRPVAWNELDRVIVLCWESQCSWLATFPFKVHINYWSVINMFPSLFTVLLIYLAITFWFEILGYDILAFGLKSSQTIT